MLPVVEAGEAKSQTAFVHTAREGRRGLRPTWNCATGDAASVDLGRKLGFVEQEELTGYPLERK